MDKLSRPSRALATSTPVVYVVESGLVDARGELSSRGSLKAVRSSFLILLLSAGLTLISCVEHRQVKFELGVLPSAWRAVRSGRVERIFHNVAGGSIYANSSCNLSDSDAPLDVLTNHLLFELKDVEELARIPLVLAGRAALRTTLDAKLDGVEIALDLIVLKIDGCSVDLQLVAAPGTISARRADFEKFVYGFVFQSGG